MRNINDMTKKELLDLPHRNWGEEIICDCLIIIPGGYREMHDSGYRIMKFVAVTDNKPTCIISGYSDVVHLDGIGGYGDNWGAKGGVPKFILPSGWNIDCLPKSGLLRLFCKGKIKCGAALSSLEIYAKERKS